MVRRDSIPKKLEALAQLLKGKTKMLIVLQEDPHPDGLASAMALRLFANNWGVSCSPACSGMPGRAEDRAPVDYANINMRSIKNVDLKSFQLIAMVDAQPGQGNASLPPSVSPDIVIDHHRRRRETRSAAFTDVRSR